MASVSPLCLRWNSEWWWICYAFSQCGWTYGMCNMTIFTQWFPFFTLMIFICNVKAIQQPSSRQPLFMNYSVVHSCDYVQIFLRNDASLTKKKKKFLKKKKRHFFLHFKYDQWFLPFDTEHMYNCILMTYPTKEFSVLLYRCI